MARQDLESWLPVERNGAIALELNAVSAAETVLRQEPMGSDEKDVPLAGGVEVTVTRKGEAYTESNTVDRMVSLKSRKFTGAVRIAEEDLQDIPEDVIRLRQVAWANTYAKKVDNAVFGVTVAEDGSGVAPFTSVYRALSTPNAGASYTANTNIIKTAGAVTYDTISQALGLVEESDFNANLIIVAHPAFKGALRTLKDEGGSPLFLSGINNTPDTLFGYQLKFSSGLKTSAAASATPTGNPLLVVGNRDTFVFGRRTELQRAVVQGFTSVGMTDEVIIKMRTRRAFTLADPRAAAIVELTAGV